MCVCVCFRSQLNSHTESIESSLENLQNILNTQTFTFDTSPLIEVSVCHIFTMCMCVCVYSPELSFQLLSSSGLSADFDIDSLDMVS